MPAKKLTKIQLSILQRLAITSPGSLSVADFSSLATVRSGAKEWANSILKVLEKHKLVEKASIRFGNFSTWCITEEGQKVLLEPQPGEDDAIDPTPSP